jgi:hypothetical protein
VGRQAASIPGFDSSTALKNSHLTWDAATLDQFLTDAPKKVPGTAMAVAIASSTERADLIAYLSTRRAPAAIGIDRAAAASGDRGPDPGRSRWRGREPAELALRVPRLCWHALFRTQTDHSRQCRQAARGLSLPLRAGGADADQSACV